MFKDNVVIRKVLMTTLSSNTIILRFLIKCNSWAVRSRESACQRANRYNTFQISFVKLLNCTEKASFPSFHPLSFNATTGQDLQWEIPSLRLALIFFFIHDRQLTPLRLMLYEKRIQTRRSLVHHALYHCPSYFYRAYLLDVSSRHSWRASCQM